MDRKITGNYLRILETAKSDAQYLSLHRQLQPLAARMLQLTQQLSNEDISILMDFIGIKESIEMRLLQIACLSMEFPD